MSQNRSKKLMSLLKKANEVMGMCVYAEEQVKGIEDKTGEAQESVSRELCIYSKKPES